jgi:hypothetical protein
MRISFGNGGWVAVGGLALPGVLYVRFRDHEGRLRPTEMYIDGGVDARPLDAADLRHLPLPLIEAAVNEEGDYLRFRMGAGSPDLSTLASYYGTGFGKSWGQIAAGNWVVASFASQMLDDGVKAGADPKTGARVMRVPKAKGTQGPETDVEQEFRLESGPTTGLTDEFLRDVSRAYRAAHARGERPNVSISEQTGYPVKTVQRWVYTARQRRIMPRGKKGSAG